MIATFYILVKVEVFVVLVKFTLDIRLTTQLLHNSQVVIVGFDQFGREVLHFYLNKTSRGGSSISAKPDFEVKTTESSLNESSKKDGVFRAVKYFSERDDLTSDAVTETLILSPSPPNQNLPNQFVYVSEYE